jgi:hypothetical protein
MVCKAGSHFRPDLLKACANRQYRMLSYSPLIFYPKNGVVCWVGGGLADAFAAWGAEAWYGGVRKFASLPNFRLKIGFKVRMGY